MAIHRDALKGIQRHISGTGTGVAMPVLDGISAFGKPMMANENMNGRDVTYEPE